MPNLMLTTRCNFQCEYCFAIDFVRAEPAPIDLTEETFEEILAWLNRRAYPGRILHLMGGEPTLHERFPCFARRACEEGFDVAVFSNAATPGAPRFAEALLDKPIRWIINVNPPSTRSPSTEENLQRTLSILKDRATLTFNITPDDPPGDWVIDLIVRHGLSKRIKIGLVLPTLSHQNRHLRREEYPKFAAKVTKFAQECDRFDISLEYECGIEHCLFSPTQLGVLWQTQSTFHSCCDSILDITPDGRIIYCLPLANFRQVSFRHFADYPEAKQWFEEQVNPYRPLGSTPRCYRCHLLMTGICRGGCLAKILKDVRHGAPEPQRSHYAV